MIPLVNGPSQKLREASIVTDSNSKTVVHLLVTENRINGVEELIKVADIPLVLDNKILVNTNFNSADPNPGSTHPDTLRTEPKG